MRWRHNEGTDTLAPANATTFYEDYDGDGFGNINSTRIQCNQPSGFVEQQGDCNDLDNAISPTAPETCNNVDDNCDGTIDEAGAIGEPTWYIDADNDGFGVSSTTTNACNQPTGYASSQVALDCDDTDANIHPNAIGDLVATAAIDDFDTDNGVNLGTLRA